MLSDLIPVFQNDQKSSIDSSFKLSVGRADRSDIPNLNVKQSHNWASNHSGLVSTQDSQGQKVPFVATQTIL